MNRLPQFLAELAVYVFVTALLAIPADEAWAHTDNSATLHAETYPLHQAARNGDLDSVNHFIIAHRADVNVKKKSGWTSLHFAAEFGYTSVVSALIAAGADVNAKEESGGSTPLHSAASSGHLSVSWALIAAGADLNMKNNDGETPLVIMPVLAFGELKSGQSCPPNIEARDKYGRTQLHLMAKSGDPSKVIMLINCGANVNALDENLATPMHFAVTSRAVSVVSELIAHGANLDAMSKDIIMSQVAFDIINIAIRADMTDVPFPPIDFWLNKYGLYGLPGGTPLHYAAARGAHELLPVLLDNGANIEAKNSVNETPLHKAVLHRQSKVVAELVRRGANLNAATSIGMTPMEYAIEANAYGLLDKLQKAAQQTRKIPQKKPKAEFASAETEAGKVFESIWRSVVVVEAGNSQGSGVALKPNLVATNCHVTDAATSPIAVYKGENRRADKGKSYLGRVIVGDRQRDVCLLAVEGLWAIPSETRNAAEMQIAEQVYAVGAPRGLDFSISGGLVSQLREEDEEGRKLSGNAPLIQTDTAISPGSSGGGLFDAKGKLVGLTTFGYRDSEGLNFAVPIEWALELIPDAEQ